jgi:hypothetical protein
MRLETVDVGSLTRYKIELKTFMLKPFMTTERSNFRHWWQPQRYCITLQVPIPKSIFLKMILLIFAGLLLSTNSFSVERRRLPGIWKLTCDSLPYEPDLRSKLKGLLLPEHQLGEEIWIKLNPDGSFKQCNEGYREGRWMSGRWEMTTEGSLLLAMNRQYYGPSFDVLLEGSLLDEEQQTEEQKQLKVQGQVQKGKFVYPQSHPCFFDQPLANQKEESLGPFTLEQSLSTFSILPTTVKVDEPADDNTKTKETLFIQVSDFDNRQFIMTIEPVQQPKERRGSEPLNFPLDSWSMPIQFFGNSTFQALAVKKILRGRFQITTTKEHDDDDDKQELFLAFEDSFFGAGLSMSGSVFTEGTGLMHEDKRSYVGSIKHDTSSGRLFVQGTVTFGSDLGSDARPELVGTFFLTETKADEDEDDSSSDNNSVFE